MLVIERSISEQGSHHEENYSITMTRDQNIKEKLQVNNKIELFFLFFTT